MNDRLILSSAGALLLTLGTSAAAEGLRSRDVLPTAWQDNLRLAVDLAVRPMLETHSDEFGHAEFAGLDLHKVFSGERGDTGTLTLQAYAIRLNNVDMHPPFFEDDYDWDVEWRIFNYNYTGLAGGRLNFKVGHFEIPFGLEQVINTNGTLRDYIHGRNFGLKADWGATVNGELPAFEYEVAVSRGSGNNWEDQGSPHILSGRVGTPRERNVVVGFSWFDGEVADDSQPDDTLERSRLGLDLQWHVGRYSLLGELSYGEDEGTDVMNGLVELDINAKDGAWFVWLQALRFAADLPDGGWDSAWQGVVGVSWEPDARWTFSAQWANDLSTIASAPEASVLAAQARYRF